MSDPGDLSRAVERWQSARPNLREAFHHSAVKLALHLADERDALLERLEVRWKWLDDHPGHPQFVEREDAVLVDLKSYEAMQDALNGAAERLFEVAA